MNCRFCNHELEHLFLDLGNSPPSNSFLTEKQLQEPEMFYPLKFHTCDYCFLVQIDEFKRHDEIFDKEYAYFSSYSKSWLEHCKRYTEKMQSRFGMTDKTKVVEIASNDGYLLDYFKEKGMSVLGIEPTSNTAKVAIEKGIKTIERFFGENLALELKAQGRSGDLLIGNNVLAHVPDINDFVKGFKIALNLKGIVTMEFPHLLNLIEKVQFDTMYHEHYSYLSFGTVKRIFNFQGLELFDVDEIPTHGGSLRIYAKHMEDDSKEISENVGKLLQKEDEFGLNSLARYSNFKGKTEKIKYDLVSFLIEKKREGKKVAAYGAAAKGNTLLNYCGVRNDLLDYIVDISPHKIGKYLPGSHIPIVHESKLKESRPDYVLILPWNIKEEIMSQLSYVRDWNAQFVMPIPKIQVV